MSDERLPGGIHENMDPDDIQESPATVEKSQKPRVPSALTVENLKKHEEEMDVVGVVELMIKNTEESVGSSKGVTSGDVLHEKNLPQDANIGLMESQLEQEAKRDENNKVSPPIACREVVRGFKLSGEEYVAVSIDVQTDESYLADYSQPREIAEPSAFHDGDIAVFDPNINEPQKFSRKHITSDISTTEIGDDESVLHISKTADSENNHQTDVSVEVEEKIVSEIPESESELEIDFSKNSIANVGPPTILQYKSESDNLFAAHADKQADHFGGNGWDNLSDEKREYYSDIMDEMKRLHQEKSESEMAENLINIEPGSSHAQDEKTERAKEREKEKRKGEAKTKARAASNVGTSGQMMSNQTNFYTFARQLKTVNYSLSSEKCMEEGWTIRPPTPDPAEESAPEMYTYDPAKDTFSGKRTHQTFVQKFHVNGSPFFTVFPDGSGNVWYQSGHIAISMIATEKVGKLTFILHDDLDINDCHNMHGVFEPNGHCTCYYPTGRIRLLLTPAGGEFFNDVGDRLKKWQWRDQQTHVHAPPFQPITFSLNKKMGVRVLSQEIIYITFTDGSRSVRFNAGTRLRYKPAAFSPKIQPLDADILLLHEKRLHIQSLVEKVNNHLRFPNSPRLKKLKLPGYLANELDRSLKIREQILLQEKHAEKLTEREKSVRSPSASFLPKRRLKRLPFYPKVSDKKDFEETKPAVIVN